jgi:predicted alpha/beta-fold hydrolase
MGGPEDLRYLSQQIKTQGGNSVLVLQSKCNEFTKTTDGISRGGSLLAEEVMRFAEQNAERLSQGNSRISFVGNSLGGLYCRYAINELFSPLDGTIAGFLPSHFLVHLDHLFKVCIEHEFLVQTIATPHLGVRDYTFLDEAGVLVPNSIKRAVAAILFVTLLHLYNH